jgi:hypothetical protein
MTSLTEDARGDLEYYMRQVRAALRGHRSVDPVEVERDVREHVDAELSELPEPIDARSLRFVLERLGAPDTWLPAEEAVGARRWLLHPPLVLGYLGLGIGLLAWPLPLVGGALTDDPALRARLAAAAANVPGMAMAAAAGAFGVWLVALGLVLRRFGKAVRVVFWPFAGGFDRRNATRLADRPGRAARLAANVDVARDLQGLQAHRRKSDLLQDADRRRASTGLAR